MDLGLKLQPIHTIYLDMDGPLVNDIDMLAKAAKMPKDAFVKLMTVRTIYGQKQALFFPLIDQAIQRNLFEKAIPTEFSKVVQMLLLPHWQTLGINVEILSSTMKENNHRAELVRQKVAWLKAHGFGHLKANFVDGSAIKQTFAKPGALLIDDYDRTISQFRGNGGFAIQYTSCQDSLDKLKTLELV